MTNYQPLTGANTAVKLKPGPKLPDAQAQHAQLVKRLLVLRDAGVTWARCSEIMGIGVSTLRNWVAAFQEDPEAQARAEDEATISELLAISMEMVRTKYVMVNAGRIVREETIMPGDIVQYGDPLEDFGPRNDAIKTALKVLERKAKLFGTDKADKKLAPLAPPQASPETDSKAVDLMAAIATKMGLRIVSNDVVDVPSRVVPQQEQADGPAAP